MLGRLTEPSSGLPYESISAVGTTGFNLSAFVTILHVFFDRDF